ncbi:hypothetical protein [Halobellus salinisoli]|uniref:hypothetical protein n=1 Tax=Halobellus salinisoli TaxID=3108500 RepID=UPI00300A54E1
MVPAARAGDAEEILSQHGRDFAGTAQETAADRAGGRTRPGLAGASKDRYAPPTLWRTMERRRALRAAGVSLTALLGGCLGSWPRATGPRNPPDAPADQPRRTPEQPDLVVGTFDFEADDEGALRVFGTVENRGDAERTGTVVVTVQTDGGSATREVDVAVDPDETVEWSVTFDVAYDEFAAGGDLNVTVE